MIDTAPSATLLAERLLDAPELAWAELGAADPAARGALAWALKDLCYACWSSEPQRAQRAAAALQRLHAGAEPGPTAVLIGALAQWTGGIAHVTQGAMREAVQAFDAAASAFRSLGEMRCAAQTQVPKVMALSMLGQHTAAADCADAARREFLALGDMHAASKVSLNLGGLHLRRDAYPEAARHYREAAVYFARVGDREHSTLADIGMADATTAMGDFDEALRLYDRAAMRARTHGFPVLQALVDESKALLALVRGHYDEALAGLESARARYEALGMPQQLAIAEKQLADAYLELCLLPEAMTLYDRVCARFESLDLPDELAWVHLQRGCAQTRSGRLADAGESFAAAAALFAEHANPVGAASVALARAELGLGTGEPQRAQAWAQTAATSFEAAERPEGALRARVLIAECALASGSVDAARERFAEALEQAHTLQLPAAQVRCLTGLGRCARAGGDAGRARSALESAIERLEDMHEALPDSDLRGAFLTGHLRPFQELVRLALDAASAQPLTAGAAAEVLRRLERHRARALRERIAAPVRERDDQRAGEALRERLNWLYRRVRQLQDEGQPSAGLAEELRSTERSLLEQVRRRRLAGGLPGRPRPAGFDPAVLQARLQPGDALVEYGVIDDELFACIVTHDAVLLRRRMASWSEVEQGLRSVRFQVESLRHGVAPVAHQLGPLTRRIQARLQTLHRQVWAPLGDVLDGCPRVLVSTQGALGGLPFAALHDGRQCVGERHALAMVPSARLAIAGLDRTPVAPRRVLALGESSRLPHAAREAREVAAMFPMGMAIVGPSATTAALREHAPQADVVHLACHAQYRGDNPMFSALHLADGVLTAEAAESLPWPRALVVLSACETALADATRDDLGGLVRGFLVGGAARVVGSLWPVDDATTAAFMSHFYTALRDGRPPSAALQIAQAQVRWTDAHPFFWSAFVLHGGW